MDNGIKSSQAGTVLRAGLNRLVKPTKMVKDAMDKYGISIQKDAEGNVELMGTVEHVREKLDGLTRTQKAQAIAQIFGTEAMSGWASLLNTSQERVEELANKIENSNGKAEEMSKIMNNTLKGSINNLKSAFEGMMITVGDIFVPIVKNVVDALTGAITKFNEMDSGTQKLAVAFGVAVASIGPLLTLIGGVGGTIMRVIPVIQGLASGMGLTLTASTALTGGLAGLGVALVGLLGYMGSNAETITTLQTKFGAFGTFCSYLGEFLYGTFQLTFGNIGILIKTLANMLGALMRGEFRECGQIWKDGWAEMSNNTAEALSNINMETAQSTQRLREMSSQELGKLNSTYLDTMNSLKTVTHDNMGQVAESFVDKFIEMDAGSLRTLRGTSDTMALLLDGIHSNMERDDAMKKLVANMEDMARGGQLAMEVLSNDAETFTNTLALNFKEGSNLVSQAGEELWENFKNVSTRGMAEVSTSIATDISKMDADTFALLQGMGGSWSQLFQGVANDGSMSIEKMAETITKNYDAMGMTSEQIMTAMEQDMQLYVTSQQLANTKLTDDKQKMVNDVTSIYNQLTTTTSSNINEVANTVMSVVDQMAIGAVTDMQGMGEGFGMVFAGIKDDGSMNSSQMKEIVIQNLTDMVNQGLPVGEMLKSGMLDYMTGMVAEGTAKAGEFSTGVTTSIQGTSDAINTEMANVPINLQHTFTEAGAVAQQGASNVKTSIETGLTGTGDAVAQHVEVSTAIGNEIAEANVQAQGASQIKNTLVTNTAGATQAVASNMSGMSSAVGAETSKAVNIANVNTNGLVQVIGSNTLGVTNVVRTNMVGMYNIVNNQTKNATTVAKQNATDLYNGVRTSYSKLLEVSRPNFINLYNVVNNQTRNARDVAKQHASDMYNGVRTSFNSMQQQGTSAINLLKNNVVNATNVMRSTAISNWQAIRSEYGRTITGKIEITKTTRENKVLTTVRQEGDASRMISEAFNMNEVEQANKQIVVASLSRLKNNDTLSVIDELINRGTKKKTITVKGEENSSNKGNTYITNNYSSPKQASIIELKRMARRENAKLGISFR